MPLNLAGTGEPLRVSGQLVTDNYFTVLGLESSLGRLFVARRGGGARGSRRRSSATTSGAGPSAPAGR